VTTPAWSVRPAADDDSWGIIALIGACWAEYPGCVMDVHGECPDLLAPATAYREGGGAMWVATDQCATVVGCVALCLAGRRVAELERLYVARAWRRRGLGRALCALVEEQGIARGTELMELWSDTRFVEAHAFYASAGYLPDDRRRELGDLSDSVERHFSKVLGGP
jgi:putative acetyltransferase